MYNITRKNSGLLIASTSPVWTKFFPGLPLFEVNGNQFSFLLDRQTVTMQANEVALVNGVAAPVLLADLVTKLTDEVLSVSNLSGAIPQMVSGGHISLATHATVGATYIAFGSQVCKQLTFINDTGVTIEVLQGGAGVAIPVFSNTAYTFFGLSNANTLSVRRVDNVAATVTVKARWEV